MAVLRWVGTLFGATKCQGMANFLACHCLISTVNVRPAQKDTGMQVKAGRKETTKQNMDFYIQMHSENCLLLLA